MGDGSPEGQATVGSGSPGADSPLTTLGLENAVVLLVANEDAPAIPWQLIEGKGYENPAWLDPEDNTSAILPGPGLYLVDFEYRWQEGNVAAEVIARTPNNERIFAVSYPADIGRAHLFAPYRLTPELLEAGDDRIGVVVYQESGADKHVSEAFLRIHKIA